MDGWKDKVLSMIDTGVSTFVFRHVVNLLVSMEFVFESDLEVLHYKKRDQILHVRQDK